MSNKLRILVADDERLVRHFCIESLKDIEGASVQAVESGSAALDILRNEPIDLVISDIKMPEGDGIDLLRTIREEFVGLPVIIITGHPTLETSMECIQLGASDYVLKPLLADDLTHSVKRIARESQLAQENQLLKRQLGRNAASGELLGNTTAIKKITGLTERYAATDIDVLIVGETGTGKELIAQMVHAGSRRISGRFVPVDCGAIPEHLLESEFFGHERGAFTGANEKKMGLMEYADGGTLFLDEIGELPTSLQSKLLRALQERKVRPVGGREEIPIDIRVIAATNRNLAEEIKTGQFREDLFFRIRVGEIQLPPLRDRVNDIPILFDHFLKLFAHDFGYSDVAVAPRLYEILRGYPWPGNVRELLNAVKRMLAVCDTNEITIEHIPDEILLNNEEGLSNEEADFFSLRTRRIEKFEREYLEALLRECSGDVTLSAKRSGIPRRTMYRMLKRYGYEPETFRTVSTTP